MGVKFTVKTPARFYFSWDVKYVSSPLSPIKKGLNELIKSRISQIQRFAFSCAHLINVYGRMNQRNQLKGKEFYMRPQVLSIFCLPELQEDGCHYNN